ncbi:redoxin domain-containing protein [Candidatus Halobonum tyrrellensis]|uniref:Alkyl hydroperoxide reductase n=1 Tax=Candidatus Halobonum tyrrellensis G22 TaxID=1324957 RepID=V4IZS9_9EURY|nr:redoxin domain-containing protein [Candidatus Halobonum tyrrellensis]ESP88657.1 alkyl hydroperoxide reductase [Candidatus Halobonum tyrrellensis G22]
MPEFDVVELPEADHPEAGEEAPDFTRPLVGAEYWSDASLSEFTDEGPVLLVCFPMDGAFPATYVWNEIRDRGWGGDDADLTVLGVSISTPYEHGTFLDERGMEYRLFSDPDAGVAESYGIEHDLDGMAGVTEHRPAVFLVDGDRTVRYAWAASEWPDFPDYDEVEAALDDL